jgi:hypothetical protein
MASSVEKRMARRRRIPLHPVDRRVVPLSSGFAFVGGHTNTLTLDGFGNLWIGDDITDGSLNFTGRPWRVPAASLTSIQ